MRQLINILFKQNWFLNYQYYVNQISIVHVTSFCFSCNINMRSTNLLSNYWNYSWHLASARFLFLFPDDTINYGITCDQCWLLSSWTFIVSFSFYKAAHSTTGPRAKRLLSSKETIKQKSTIGLIQSSPAYKTIQSSSTREHQDIQGSSSNIFEK